MVSVGKLRIHSEGCEGLSENDHIFVVCPKQYPSCTRNHSLVECSRAVYVHCEDMSNWLLSKTRPDRRSVGHKQDGEVSRV